MKWKFGAFEQQRKTDNGYTRILVGNVISKVTVCGQARDPEARWYRNYMATKNLTRPGNYSGPTRFVRPNPCREKL